MSGIHLGISEASFIVLLAQLVLTRATAALLAQERRGGEKLKKAFSFLSESVTDSSI